MDIVCGIGSQSEHRPRSFFSLTHPEPKMWETFVAQPSPTLWRYLDSTRTQIHRAWRNHLEALNFKWGKTQSTHLVVLWENEPLLMSPKLIITSSHYYSACGLLNSSVLTVLWHIVCFFLPQKLQSRGTCNTCEGNPSQGDVLCREQSLQVDKLADTLPAVSGAPQEKNKTDKADNMTNWCLRN